MKERNLRCPVCDAALVVKRADQVLVDVCEEHGMWLDKGELRAIMTKRRLLQISSQRLLREAKQDGRAEGAFFGWWSLLFPLPGGKSKKSKKKRTTRR